MLIALDGSTQPPWRSTPLPVREAPRVPSTSPDVTHDLEARHRPLLPISGVLHFQAFCPRCCCRRVTPPPPLSTGHFEARLLRGGGGGEGPKRQQQWKPGALRRLFTYL